MDTVTVQRILKPVDEELTLAVKYYSILSIIHNLELTGKQIELLSFTAVRGSISSISVKKAFIEMFDSSLPYVEKMKSKLIKLKLLIKQDGEYKVNPVITLDFSKDLLLQLHFKLDGKQ